MSLVFARVDQKLIHGQVCVAWIPHLSVDTIIVVDEDLLVDSWSQKIMKLGLPLEIKKVFFISPEILSSFLKTGDLLKSRILILFKNILAVNKAVNSGLNIKTLNLGNQVYQITETTFKLSDSFFVTEEDIKTLFAFEKQGIDITVQAAPKAKNANVSACLKKIK